MVRLDEVDLPEVDEEQGRGEDAGGPARGMDASARPQQPGWGEGRPTRRSGRSRRTAHGPAPGPARRGRRPCPDCAAGVVALSGETAAGAPAPLEPHPPAALALLSAAARGERRCDSRVGPGTVDTGAHPGQGRTPARGDAGPAASEAPDPPG